MASFFATDFLGTAPSTSATGQNGSVIAQLVKIAINMHFCDFSMIAYLSDPSGADLTLGLVFFNFGFLPSLSDILVCHIAEEVRG